MSGGQVVPLIYITDVTSSVTLSRGPDRSGDFHQHPLLCASSSPPPRLLLSSRVWWREIMDCVAPRCDGGVVLRYQLSLFIVSLPSLERNTHSHFHRDGMGYQEDSTDPVESVPLASAASRVPTSQSSA
ncbi:hypothetical protein EYF80_054661 [Liparis tanakae]|uniref:Uncharacterized protein n=1 Tax=Liparis tanakae TaxID=230148 RepID=A0A4Z2F2M7_9TELE|nr:hypothetical protein EYF80_054661 [Liparis tanakae]